MSAPLIYPISDEDRQLWAEQNIADLLETADLPFARKIQMLEEMDEVIRSIHQGKLPPSPDEHAELRW
jgi:hypothetical protein